MPPPTPVIVAAPSPDPNLSPPIPPLDWEPLPPSPPVEEPSAPPLPAALFVPPPQTETVQQSQPAGDDSFTPGVPNLQDLEMALPEVEVWRAQSVSPQMPARRHRRFDMAYVVGKEPSVVRLRFHPLAAGQAVVVQPGPGVTIDPPDAEFRVDKNGECVVWVALDWDFILSDLNVYCAGVKTKVPLERATVELVEAREAAGRSGQ